MKRNSCCFSAREYNKACWLIEKRCNLNCEFCFHSQFGTNENLNEGKHCDYSQMVLDMKKHKIKHVILSGGEPLLSCDLFGIINLLESNGFIVSISTNAILATSEFCKRLKNTGVKKITVNLAAICNKSGRIIDDEISSNVINGIQNLASAGFSVTLNSILSSSTTKEILMHNIEHCSQWGANTISFTVPVCKCSFDPTLVDYHISNEDVLQLMTFLEEIESEYAPSVNIEFNWPNCTMDDCPAGKTIFGIGAEGIVSSCLVKQYQML